MDAADRIRRSDQLGLVAPTARRCTAKSSALPDQPQSQRTTFVRALYSSIRCDLTGRRGFGATDVRTGRAMFPPPIPKSDATTAADRMSTGPGEPVRAQKRGGAGWEAAPILPDERPKPDPPSPGTPSRGRPTEPLRTPGPTCRNGQAPWRSESGNGATSESNLDFRGSLRGVKDAKGAQWLHISRIGYRCRSHPAGARRGRQHISIHASERGVVCARSHRPRESCEGPTGARSPDDPAKDRAGQLE